MLATVSIGVWNPDNQWTQKIIHLANMRQSPKQTPQFIVLQLYYIILSYSLVEVLNTEYLANTRQSPKQTTQSIVLLFALSSKYHHHHHHHHHHRRRRCRRHHHHHNHHHLLRLTTALSSCCLLSRGCLGDAVAVSRRILGQTVKVMCQWHHQPPSKTRRQLLTRQHQQNLRVSRYMSQIICAR